MNSFALSECNENVLGVQLVGVRPSADEEGLTQFERHVQLLVVMKDPQDLSTVLRNAKDAISSIVGMRDRDKVKAIRDIMSLSTYLDENGRSVLVMHVERTPELSNMLPRLRALVKKTCNIAATPLRVEHVSIDCPHTNMNIHTHQLVWDLNWFEKLKSVVPRVPAADASPLDNDSHEDEIGDLLQVVQEYTDRIDSCNETLQSAVQCMYHGDVKTANHMLETVGAYIPRVIRQ